MNKITEQIWIGNSQDARNADALRTAGISCILNVAEDLPPALGWKDGFTHYHIGLRDASNYRGLYVAAVETLGAIVLAGKKVLVHCHEGRSRSVYIVACHMSTLEPDHILDMIEFIRTLGRDVDVKNGHFESYP